MSFNRPVFWWQRLADLALFCGAALLFACACTAQAQTPGAELVGNASAKLPAHPRLLATQADWLALAARRATDPDLNRLIDLQLERARKDLILAPLERKLKGRRLLSVSREFIRRSLLWSFAYRVSGDRIFLDRARREMLSVAAFSDWNHSHFLDVAEMTTGLAISYDWLYEDLPADERATLRRAIVDKGIAQARNGHATFKYNNNWGQVCIGGMVLGALAVQEDEPELVRDLLVAAKANVHTALNAYKPDGIYPEGPGYWVYGTSYSVLLVAALRGTIGNDWGVLDSPGLKRSADFFAHAVSPSGRQFNFSDGGEGQEISPPLFYLARELRQPVWIEAKRTMIRNKQGLNERFAPLIALWWPDRATAEPAALNFNGQGPQPVSIWRSSWTDPNALYFAIKGGGANHNHAHMDAGSFVIDLDGIRWAKDLGMQDYNSLESRGVDLWNMKQGSGRWQVFRLSNAAHNTISIDTSLHNSSGMATLQMIGETETMIDLSPVFLSGQLKKATRHARVDVDGLTVTLTDKISGAKPGSRIRWVMNTEASISINGHEATLGSGDKTLHVRFSGTPVTLEVHDISNPRTDLDVTNPNSRQLIALAPTPNDGNWNVSVRFSRD